MNYGSESLQFSHSFKDILEKSSIFDKGLLPIWQHIFFNGQKTSGQDPNAAGSSDLDPKEIFMDPEHC